MQQVLDLTYRSQMRCAQKVTAKHNFTGFANCNRVVSLVVQELVYLFLELELMAFFLRCLGIFSFRFSRFSAFTASLCAYQELVL